MKDADPQKRLKHVIRTNILLFKQLIDLHQNNDDLGTLVRILTLDEIEQQESWKS